jgi:hypothetical protein
MHKNLSLSVRQLIALIAPLPDLQAGGKFNQRLSFGPDTDLSNDFLAHNYRLGDFQITIAETDAGFGTLRRSDVPRRNVIAKVCGKQSVLFIIKAGKHNRTMVPQQRENHIRILLVAKRKAGTEHLRVIFRLRRGKFDKVSSAAGPLPAGKNSAYEQQTNAQTR